MTDIKNHEKYERLETQLWKRTCVDEKGQTTLPKKLRLKLGINDKKTTVLWMSIHRTKKDNIFMIELGVKK